MEFWLSQEGRPWYNAPELDLALVQAQRDWTRSLLSSAENNQESREAIGKLTLPTTGEGTIVERPEGTLRLLSLSARWDDGGYVAVRPVNQDSVRRKRRSVFGLPDNEHPIGQETADGIVIISTSPPDMWSATWLTESKPDGENNPDQVWAGVGELHQQQIMQRAVQWLLHQQDNTPAWQRQAQTTSSN